MVAPAAALWLTGWLANSGPPVTKLQVVPMRKSLIRIDPQSVAPERQKRKKLAAWPSSLPLAAVIVMLVVGAGATAAPKLEPAGLIQSRALSLPPLMPNRKSTRLNSSHLGNSYAVFC